MRAASHCRSLRTRCLVIGNLAMPARLELAHGSLGNCCPSFGPRHRIELPTLGSHRPVHAFRAVASTRALHDGCYGSGLVSANGAPDRSRTDTTCLRRAGPVLWAGANGGLGETRTLMDSFRRAAPILWTTRPYWCGRLESNQQTFRSQLLRLLRKPFRHVRMKWSA